MTVQIAVGLSTLPDPLEAGAEAGASAAQELEGARPDLALVFLAGRPLAAPEATLEGVHDTLAPEALVGCGAGGVLAGGRELEQGSATAVWAASLGGGTATTFHASLNDDEANPAIAGLPRVEDGRAAIMLADPYSFPTDPLLSELALDAPGVPILGGLASGRTADGSAALLFGEEVHESGAVGVLLEGVELLPCVSQGAAPLGPELTITSAEGTRPAVGLKPTTPQKCAGTRTEPARSLPRLPAVMHAATAAAHPPLEPPGVRVSSCGLFVRPKTGLSALYSSANSDVFVLPSMIAPAARRRATAGASARGTWPARNFEPPVALMPRVSIVSFTDRGTPSNAPKPSPRMTLPSASRARSIAFDACVTTALSFGFKLSMRRR